MKNLDELVGLSHFGPTGPSHETDVAEQALRMRNFVLYRAPDAVGHMTLPDGSCWECRNVDGSVRWALVEGE